MWFAVEQIYAVDGALAGEASFRLQLTGDAAIERQYEERLPTENPLTHLTMDRRHTWATEDDTRRWRGPDFVGTGQQHRRLLYSRGLWPRMGYTGEMMQLDISDTRRVMVNRYTVAGDTVAYSLALVDQSEYPSFQGPKWAGMISGKWRGTVNGEKSAIARRYSGLSFEQHRGPQRMVTVELETWTPDTVVSGTFKGISRIRGPMLSFEAVMGPSTMVRATEILDAQSETLIAVWRYYQDNLLNDTHVIHLQPE